MHMLCSNCVTNKNDNFAAQVEEDLLQEKLKIKKVSDDLNQTFDDMLQMAC